MSQDPDGEPITVPSAETLADQTNVKILEVLAQKLDKPYHRECEAALAPLIKEITSDDNDAGYHRGPVKGLARMNEKLAEYVGDHKEALKEGKGDDGKQFPRAACVITNLS